MDFAFVQAASLTIFIALQAALRAMDFAFLGLANRSNLDLTSSNPFILN